jgi:hypothetical protein
MIEKLERLICDRQKQMEETKDWSIRNDGREYAKPRRITDIEEIRS